MTAVPDPYGPLVADAARRNGVPYGILAAQLQQESGYDARAYSSAGAEGIGQFMPATARGYGIDPWDARQSINAAAKYDADLHRDLAPLGQSWALALAGYNAGEGSVRAYGGVPPASFANGQTYNYVNTIMAAAGSYATPGAPHASASSHGAGAGSHAQHASAPPTPAVLHGSARRTLASGLPHAPAAHASAATAGRGASSSWMVIGLLAVAVIVVLALLHHHDGATVTVS